MGRYSATIDDTGISGPDFPTVLANLTADYFSIYGSDVLLDPSTKDAQMLAVVAKGFSDNVASQIAVFNSYRPGFAQGAGLASIVKINGLSKKIPSSSIATVTLVAQAGITIENGQATDGVNTWVLPEIVEIPNSGTIDVTVACATLGAITADPGAINDIKTPVFGWQSVTNAAAAIPGTPVELDAALRIRQTQSTTLPSISIFEGMIAAVQNLPGVTRCRGYENNTGSTNGLGIPANTLSVIVEGGTPDPDIYQTIFIKGPPGIPTAGAQSKMVIDSNGSTRPVKFDRPTNATIAVTFTLKSLPGWSSSVAEPLITAGVQAFIQGWPIGGDPDSKLSWSQLVIAAAQAAGSQASTFKVTSVALTKNGTPTSPTTNTDVALAYNEAAVAGTVSYVIT